MQKLVIIILGINDFKEIPIKSKWIDHPGLQKCKMNMLQ